MVPKDEADTEAFRAIIWNPETVAAFAAREMAQRSIMRHILDVQVASYGGRIRWDEWKPTNPAQSTPEALESAADGQLAYRVIRP